MHKQFSSLPVNLSKTEKLHVEHGYHPVQHDDRGGVGRAF
jgi:hypothetical protein